MGSTDLNVVLVSNRVEAHGVVHQLWEIHVHGGAHAGSQIGGAGRDVAEMVIVGEIRLLFNQVGGASKPLEDLANVRARLHGNDTELILLVNPHKEGLVVVVVDSTSLRPIALASAGLEVLVSSLE